MSHDPGKLFDDFAKLMTDASGAAQSFGREVETAFRAQTERFANEMGFVNRESHDALKDMAVLALDRIDELQARIEKLEARLATHEAASPGHANAGSGNPQVKGAAKPAAAKAAKSPASKKT